MLIISLKELPHKEQHDYAHRLLDVCLKKRGIDYGTASIQYGKQGKPFLPDYPELHYNLTHADGITACIVSDRECGIDGEKVRPYRPNVLKRAFSDAEREMLENAPESERDMLFFRLWTLKESYVKAIGIGISYPLSKVEFSFEGDEIITNIKGWRFKQYLPEMGKYAVSVCLREQSAAL